MIDTRPVLAFDIGGTHTRSGLLDPQTGKLFDVRRTPTSSHWNSPQTSSYFDELANAVASEVSRRSLDLLACSIAFPGPLSPGGVPYNAATIAKAEAPPITFMSSIRDLLKDTPLFIINDVSALGYAYFTDEDYACLLNVGSGVGMKVFHQGEPLLGPSGAGGELGHWRPSYVGPDIECECGGLNHLSAIASGRGARRVAEALGLCLDTTNPDWLLRPTAKPVLDVVASALSSAIGAIYTAIGVQRFVLVGGLANALGSELVDLIGANMPQHCWNLGVDWRQCISCANSSDTDAILGAGLYATRRLKGGLR